MLVFFFLFVFVNPVSASYCGSGECFTSDGVCATSDATVLCTECFLTGYLNATGHCVQTTSSSTSVTTVVPLCADDDECETDEGECVESKRGRRCRECNFRGWMSDDIENGGYKCTCYHPSWDPNAACSALVDLPSQQIDVTVAYDSVTCVSHTQKELGFFAPVAESTYGEIGPSTPIRCWSDVYGPEPGQLVETAKEPFAECNTFVGIDPDLDDGIKRTCSGVEKGTWNFTSYACDCKDKWQATFAGYDYYGAVARTCGTCRGFFAPRPEWGFDPPHCSRIYTPDVLDGVTKECGGHGKDVDGSCVCFSNVTAGYWDLMAISDVFLVPNGDGTTTTFNHSVETCARCQFGYSGSDCTVLTGITRSPTTSEPTSEPTSSPTPSPSAFCEEGCPAQDEGVSLFSSTFFLNVSTLNISDFECCTPDYVNEQDWLNVANGTCTATFATRQVLAWDVCRKFVACAGFSWWESDSGNFTYRFFESVSTAGETTANAGSGLPCVRTTSPTVSPTRYPTSFPSKSPTT